MEEAAVASLVEESHEEGEIVEEGKEEREREEEEEQGRDAMEVQQEETANGHDSAENVDSVNNIKGAKRARNEEEEEKEGSRKKSKKDKQDRHSRSHRSSHHHHHHSHKHKEENGKTSSRKRRDIDREKEATEEEKSKKRKQYNDEQRETMNGAANNGKEESKHEEKKEGTQQKISSHSLERQKSASRERERENVKDRGHREGGDRNNRDRERERDTRGSRESLREQDRDRRERDRREREREDRERRQRDRENWEKERERRERERIERHRKSGYNPQGGGSTGANNNRGKQAEPSSETMSHQPEEKKKTPEELKREEEEYQRKVELALKKRNEEEDLTKIQEERKRRREMIMAKYKKEQEAKKEEPIFKEEKKEIPEVKEVAKQEEKKDFASAVVANNGSHQETNTVKLETDNEPLMKKPLEQEPDKDKFATVSDMFTDVPTVAIQKLTAEGANQILDETWDDEDGYYCVRVGEVLNNKYRVVGGHGKGVFSTVLTARTITKAEDGEEGEEVAIKVIRNKEVMYRAGLKERDLLKLIAASDPHNKKHCIRMLNSFMHRNHLCLVLEPMHMDMREVIKKYGRDIGITIQAVKIYAKQLFVALKYLKSLKILHADLKPDNIVTNQSKTVLKLCDFGSASSMEEENPITPYLVSRFYRAPEISLPYDYAMDVWATGCCIYEMYTGKICFPGQTNNEMLKLHMQVKGMFSRKMLRRGKFWTNHFDENSFAFLEGVSEGAGKSSYVRQVSITRPTRDLRADLLKIPHDAKEVQSIEDLADLLEQCFTLNPQKRITCEQALRHPFLTA